MVTSVHMCRGADVLGINR